MGIASNFDMNGINQMLGNFQNAVENNVVRILRLVGEKCVNEARLSGSYQDRTANLRASAGYIIVNEGRVYEEDFQSGEGGQKASDLAHDLAAQYPQGAALIVVSGMNYAVYVESKGYNVLTSAELLAEREVPNLLRQLR